MGFESSCSGNITLYMLAVITGKKDTEKTLKH